ncbi:2-amino-3-ketobutyrate coenzyme A ligase, mitochondrial-like [Corticium candelabrum]|uniref:2-amino-3-ketobutyrate coenzyme A ligase, mitochondrial-like n=1 Tax=Corticium candelabrum TaxID=121492 RepID=UPI002E25C705|nr:2-amino-3-ketobutyrate coenzyme A ligase, mitochondrial-like [Corticium candelabrum]
MLIARLFRRGSFMSLLGLHARSAAGWAHMRRELTEELDLIRSSGLWKSERVITTRQEALIGVGDREERVLNFCANNYLGLSSHPDVIQAGKNALDSHGAGLSSVRFICGTQDIHVILEQKISAFHSRDDTIVYASCFDANAGLFEALLGPDDAVISDELNHASIIDGIRLCKAKKYRYQHKDMRDLRDKLQQAKDAPRKMIATDGVFSMDGDVASLREICDLADEYNAIVMVDECHATGFLGKTGRGTEELLDVAGRVDIINSTLGKAMGGAAGGYTTGHKEIVSLLRQRSRPYLFSNSLPPPVVAQASKVYDLLMMSSELPEKVARNTSQFRSRMKAAGFTISGDDHPICPVMLGDAKLATEIANEMLDLGIFVIGFSYPVVPKGKARIRVQLSAVHSLEDVDRCVDAFIEIGKKKGIIP